MPDNLKESCWIIGRKPGSGTLESPRTWYLNIREWRRLGLKFGIAAVSRKVFMRTAWALYLTLFRRHITASDGFSSRSAYIQDFTALLIAEISPL